MNPNIMECDDHKLKLLLAADEQAVEHDPWMQHVEHCSHCQLRLRELAAQADDWQKAAEVLAADDDDVPYFGRDHDAPSSWNESMVKQLLEPPSHPEMLGRLGRYEMERMIGCGGMGIVFKAFDTELNRVVAVKLLEPYLAARGSARKRFAREARAAAGVRDDHVVPIFNVESEHEPPFLVMQYVAGGSLQEKLDRDGPLEVAEVLRIGLQTAKGLAAAHAQGLIHRDVKPSNILLDEGVERALLTDFGLARAEDDACLTRSGFHPGTPHYMSPEQVRGEAIDGRSDLFSLGCVLYALCTGHPPFRAETSYAVMRRITDESPRPIREQNANIHEWLEAIVMKLLSKSREGRFASAKEVAELLEDCLAHVQQPTVKKLPGSLMKHLVRVSGSSRPARLMQQFKRSGIRTWLIAGISVTAIILIAMMLQDDGPQRSSQGEPGPLTVAQANLGELLQQQKAREESIRQISYQGTVRQYARQDIKRTQDESVDEFVARCVGLAPVYDDFPPYPLRASRDFKSGVYRFTIGDINEGMPNDIKYMDWFIEKGHYVQLMGREPGSCEAVVTNNREDFHDDREVSLVRLDIVAFRPVKDILMSEVLTKAISEPGIPDVGGRPLWKLEPLSNKVGWKATFMFQQPVANPPGAKQILWHRVYWEQVGGELVIVRVDQLTVDGDENSTPRSVTLIDDYRSVCGKTVPFRVRCFVLGDSFVQGAEFTVSDMKVNDYVDVPKQMPIPAGSPVKNQITGKKFRQPAYEPSDTATDTEHIQGTWNVVEMRQEGYEPNESESEFYKSGGYKITFTKNKMIHSPDHSSMQYRVDAKHAPHVLELLQSGKVIAKAIYELTGDDLKICQGRTPTDGSEPKPPTSFDITQAVGSFPTLMILRRTKRIEPIAIPMGAGASDAATGTQTSGATGKQKVASEPKRLQICEATVVDPNANSSQPSVEFKVVELSGMRLLLDPAQPAILTEDDIESVELDTNADNSSAPQIVISLNPKAAERFLSETTRLSSLPTPGYLVIEFDGKVLSAPRVNDKISNKVAISYAERDMAEMENIVAAIRVAMGPNAKNDEAQVQRPGFSQAGGISEQSQAIPSTAIPITEEPKLDNEQESEQPLSVEGNKSSDHQLIETPALPKALDKSAQESDSQTIYTAEELIANGMELHNKQQRVTVRFEVASVRRNGVIEPDGKQTQHWFLSSEEYKGRLDSNAFQVQVSMDAEKALERSGVKDIPVHFNGKELTIVGKVSTSGLELPGRDTIWFYSITLDSLDQLDGPVGAAESITGQAE